MNTKLLMTWQKKGDEKKMVDDFLNEFIDQMEKIVDK